MARAVEAVQAGLRAGERAPRWVRVGERAALRAGVGAALRAGNRAALRAGELAALRAGLAAREDLCNAHGCRAQPGQC